MSYGKTADTAIKIMSDDDDDDSGSKPKRKKMKTEKEGLYWFDSSDAVEFDQSSERQCIGFTIHGKPQALRRPGPRLYSKSSRGRPFFNPSKPKQDVFRKVLHEILPPIDEFLFPPGMPIEARVVFRFRRPNTHFINNNRERGLKPGAPTEFALISPDVDNLAKFVLDCLNGIIYKDDRQVAVLTAIKLWDSAGGSGSTYMKLSCADLSQENGKNKV